MGYAASGGMAFLAEWTGDTVGSMHIAVRMLCGGIRLKIGPCVCLTLITAYLPQIVGVLESSLTWLAIVISPMVLAVHMDPCFASGVEHEGTCLKFDGWSPVTVVVHVLINLILVGALKVACLAFVQLGPMPHSVLQVVRIYACVSVSEHIPCAALPRRGGHIFGGKSGSRP